jgi:hypothetical protein
MVLVLFMGKWPAARCALRAVRCAARNVDVRRISRRPLKDGGEEGTVHLNLYRIGSIKAKPNFD